VEGGVLPQCGHWMPEEQPAALAERLLAFFAGVDDVDDVDSAAAVATPQPAAAPIGTN
jgi:hypothetical protein